MINLLTIILKSENLAIMKNTIICIMGPTASGKTDLAISLVEKMPAEIISVDSAMVYKTMDIGTGKPTDAELQKAPHHLINLIDPKESYSTGQFCKDAEIKIKEVISRNHTPLLVGGTMLYFHKLLYGLADLPLADKNIRNSLDQEIKELGLEKLYERLQKIDPIAASKIKPQDPQRIQRALEVYLLTGKPISSFHAAPHNAYINNFNIKLIALIPEDRAWLHTRIEQRFDKMLAAGLIDEVKKLHDRADLQADMTAMRMVGYRQAWEYCDGKTDFETMRQKALAATRQLAKRQLTWLRSWDNVTVMEPNGLNLSKILYE